MKKGISLHLGRSQIWVESTEAVNGVLNNGSAYRLHLGGNIYYKVAEYSIRKNY
jgi:hypothetical protein